MRKTFIDALQIEAAYQVLYNTNESKKIITYASEEVDNVGFQENQFKIVGVGKLLKNKGFDRLLKITKRLVGQDYNLHIYIFWEKDPKGII